MKIALLCILLTAPLYQASSVPDIAPFTYAAYNNLGCWRDTNARAIPTKEGGNSLLDGRYTDRSSAIAKCARVAYESQNSIFGIQNGGWCASSPNAESTYEKYGRSTACNNDGKGGPWANQVYELKKIYNVELENLGCWRDTSDRAVRTLEGLSPRLNGQYQRRRDAIKKCARAALDFGYDIIAVQNGGWCASSRSAVNTYKRYGNSGACLPDGKGGPWANEVYKITSSLLEEFSGPDEQIQSPEDTPKTIELQGLGCWRDTANRAIPTLEGLPSSTLLDGRYQNRENAIQKCAREAVSLGYDVIAIQNGGWCASSANAIETYKKYGSSSACANDGEGGPWANNVYYIGDEAPPQTKPVQTIPVQNLGCWRDTSNRAIPTLEGLPSSTLLDGRYQYRDNAIQKCADQAKLLGYDVIAVQNGGWCASSANAENTFWKYGRSSSCSGDGEGGPWANQVYYLGQGDPPVPLTDKDTPFEIVKKLGCWRDTSVRAVPTLESFFRDNYTQRPNAIQQCASVALSQGYNVIAIQNGGWCASSADAIDTYQRYGKSTACRKDGEGGPWANEVYEIRRGL